jgi:rubrerythrin
MDKDKFYKVMDLAIKREVEAYEFYKDVAERIDDKAIQKIFKTLATEEVGHKDLLERFKYNPDLPVKMSSPEIDYHLAEEVELPELSIDMKPADALALAMKKEQLAVEFYRKLANQTEDGDVKKLLLEIANMELSHKQKLENAYTDIAYVEAF